ncbi:MAG: RNA 2',3'-cyclic phosphodiesterase [Candidatus Micrarchaeota archaeon]
MRLFVSIEVPSNVRQKLLALREDIPISNAALTQPHCTLCFIGETPESQLSEIIAKLSTVKFKPFQITAQGIGVFPSLQNPRVVWVGLHSQDSQELTKLAQDIRTVLNLPQEDFVGHCTLTRLKPSEVSEKTRKMLKKYEKNSFGVFPVTSFELKQSVFHTGKAVHIVLKTFKNTVFV